MPRIPTLTAATAAAALLALPVLAQGNAHQGNTTMPPPSSAATGANTEAPGATPPAGNTPGSSTAASDSHMGTTTGPSDNPAKTTTMSAQRPPSNAATTGIATPARNAGVTAPAPAANTASNQEKRNNAEVANGDLRSSKLVGQAVYNQQNQKIGDIDDILMGKQGAPSTAVLSVGGYLGSGSKLVAVPFQDLQIQGDHIMMPNGSKSALAGMPAFKYSAQG